MNTWKVGDKVIVDGRAAVVIRVDHQDHEQPLQVEYEDGVKHWPDISAGREVSLVSTALPTDLGELEALAARVAEAIAEAKRPTFKVGDKVTVDGRLGIVVRTDPGDYRHPISVVYLDSDPNEWPNITTRTVTKAPS